MKEIKHPEYKALRVIPFKLQHLLAIVSHLEQAKTHMDEAKQKNQINCSNHQLFCMPLSSALLNKLVVHPLPPPKKRITRCLQHMPVVLHFGHTDNTKESLLLSLQVRIAFSWLSGKVLAIRLFTGLSLAPTQSSPLQLVFNVKPKINFGQHRTVLCSSELLIFYTSLNENLK